MIAEVGYRRLLRPLLFRAYGGDAERVHAATLGLISRVGEQPAARRVLAARRARHQSPVTVAGITFGNRVGLAAGMDKDGLGLRSWAALGFGHAELGTVTPRPQPGNERPRLVRLPASAAIINRMGFNNAGAAALSERLERAGVRRGHDTVGLRIGISLGKNRTTPMAEAALDYLAGYRSLARYADYVAVNVSSPNTAGLRSLQDAEPLGALLRGLRAEPVGETGRPPLFLKLAPDLSFDALEEALGVAVASGVGGLIATNTTLARDGLAATDRVAGEQPGGLSGAPLTERARAVVGFLAARTDLPVIGVGGVLTADDGEALLDAGASLIQLYTGFVYGGPPLVTALNRRFADRAPTPGLRSADRRTGAPVEP